MSTKQAHNITQRALMALVERQQYRCALTGRALTPETASVDHRVPMTRGGCHAMENVWLVHEAVNRAKGTMTESEFIQLCHDVVAFQAAKAAAVPMAQPDPLSQGTPHVSQT